MTTFQFGLTYLHDQLEIMIETAEAYKERMEEIKKLDVRTIDHINECLDLKYERELLEKEISNMIEFIGITSSLKEEYQKKKNAGAEATDKTKISKKIIT